MNGILLVLAGVAVSFSVLAGDASAGTDAIPDASITVMLTGTKPLSSSTETGCMRQHTGPGNKGSESMRRQF
jgi:hypothetical protein